ncbi:MAG TPA: hypothetical protein VND83_01915 [Acidimicrobiales bacterium]|nr:hypothetical protein [Acidimicrobiales bacterium]
MELRHLETRLDQRDAVGAVVEADASPLVLECRDGDVVTLAASLRDGLARPIGVWVEVSRDYPAALVARDAATLAHLVELDHVVVAGDAARDQADVVRSLLTNDEVNFANAAATLHGAYNRPAPPRPVTVWAYEASALVSPGERLVAQSRKDSAAGPVTSFR